MKDLIQDLRLRRANASEETGIHVDRNHHARAWHWREQRDLQRRQCGAAASAAFSAARTIGDGQHDEPRSRLYQFRNFDARLSRVAGTQAQLRKDGRLQHDELQHLRHDRARASDGRAGVADLFGVLGVGPGARPRVYRRRGDLWQASRGDRERGSVAAEIRRRGRSHRSNDDAQRRAIRDRRGDASHFQFPDPTVVLWTPLAVADGAENNTRGNYWLGVVGRLKSGIAASQAQRSSTAFFGNSKPRIRFSAASAHRLFRCTSRQSAAYRPRCFVLLAAVALVLLIACATSPICCSRARRQGSGRLRFAPRSARAGTIDSPTAHRELIAGSWRAARSACCSLCGALTCSLAWAKRAAAR